MSGIVTTTGDDVTASSSSGAATSVAVTNNNIVQQQHQPDVSSSTTSTSTIAKKTPSDFLKSIIGRPIRVKLNSGSIEYRGVLGSLDGYLNIAIEQTEEYNHQGQLQAKYGDCFIRGNNVMYISKPPQR